MNTMKLRELHLLMNAELALACQASLNKFAFLLSLEGALEGKDGLDEEERFDDDTYELQDKLYNIYLPMMKEVDSHSRVLPELGVKAHIIPTLLLEDLNVILTYKEDSNNITDSPFSPYDIDKDSFIESIMEFYIRLLSILRVDAWIEDIEMGIQEYGINPYVVPEEDDNTGVNILDGIYEMSLDEMKEEVDKHLLIRDNDTDQQQEDKASLKALMVTLEKYEDK